jgi:hypothetical protein
MTKRKTGDWDSSPRYQYVRRGNFFKKLFDISEKEGFLKITDKAKPTVR